MIGGGEAQGDPRKEDDQERAPDHQEEQREVSENQEVVLGLIAE